MTTNSQVIDRYAAAAPDGAMLRPRSNNVYVSDDGRTIYSYGSHFPMAHIMPDGDSPRGWWLVNGDSYSPTTNGHQSSLRGALAKTHLPMLIVPFSALERAGISQDTIKPVQIMPDEFETVWHSEDKPDGTYAYDYRDMPDGSRQWASRVHHLGASVFTATYRGDWTGRNYSNHRASFLSAFDDQEGAGGLYFLAQLPDGSNPETVAEAFTALRPMEVRAADVSGLPVTRQGDVFAVPSELGTRDLPGPSRRGEYVLGVNHTATEVRTDGMGNDYGRGHLRHRPQEWGRLPEHRRQRMGDGKTWHRLVKNTVPAGRSWSVGGGVD